MFPIFLKLGGRKALVVGGGKMAAVRAKQLISAGAKVTVVSPKVGNEIESLAKAKSVVLVRRGFRPTDLSRRYFIVIAATDDPKTQQAFFATWWTSPSAATFICRRFSIAVT